MHGWMKLVYLPSLLDPHLFIFFLAHYPYISSFLVYLNLSMVLLVLCGQTFQLGSAHMRRCYCCQLVIKCFVIVVLKIQPLTHEKQESGFVAV